MKLFIWTISDTVVEQGTAIGFAATKAEAIEAICDEIEDEEIRVPLRDELEQREPDVEVETTYGWFSESPT